MFKLSPKTLTRDIYENFIDKNHFLAQLDWVFNWDELAEPLFDLAKNAHYCKSILIVRKNVITTQILTTHFSDVSQYFVK